MEFQILMPPRDLIVENAIGHNDVEDILQEFDSVGRSVAHLVIEKCGVQSRYAILDVGVGLGRVARIFTGVLDRGGTYVGIDTTRSSIEWCKKNYTDFRNFSFFHSDVYSTKYNPYAIARPEDYKFPLSDNSFDVVFSSSLYTHMLFEGVENYLAEMARVLKPGGYTLNTYFLLDDVTRQIVDWSPVPGGAVWQKDIPEAVVGLEKDLVVALHQRLGLEITELALGGWSGREDFTTGSYQDFIVARKNG